MSTRRHTPEQIITVLREVEVGLGRQPSPLVGRASMCSSAVGFRRSQCGVGEDSVVGRGPPVVYTAEIPYSETRTLRSA